MTASTPDPTSPSAGNAWRRIVSRPMRNLRRTIRIHGGSAIRRVLGQRQYNSTSLCAADISSVMICRINGRIGNTMFLTAGIRYLHQLMPHAAIDVVAAHPKSRELLSGLPGVRRVIVFPHRTGHMVWRYLKAVAQMRAIRYDLAIDPVIESTSNRIAVSLCRSRRRMGFLIESQWAPLTHVAQLPENVDVMHQAVRPIYLMSRLFGVPFEPDNVRLWLPLKEGERAHGRLVIGAATGVDPASNPNIIGFFSHATDLKTISRVWWIAFWHAFTALEPDAIPVEFLPRPDEQPLIERFKHVHIPSLRGVTAAISATQMFVSSDTGPMHLASSTKVPTIGFFQASGTDLFGPLKPNDLAIDITPFEPAEVAARCSQAWRARATAVANHTEIPQAIPIAS